MKKLQNDFTTPEQSKRLLELGVPEDSANYCYECSLIGGEKYYARELLDDTTFSKYKRAYDSPCVDIIPCWSVGRLNEIFKICSDNHIEIYDLDLKGTQIERAMQAFENYAKYNWLDFSTLEE